MGCGSRPRWPASWSAQSCLSSLDPSATRSWMCCCALLLFPPLRFHPHFTLSSPWSYQQTQASGMGHALPCSRATRLSCPEGAGKFVGPAPCCPPTHSSTGCRARGGGPAGTESSRAAPRRRLQRPLRRSEVAPPPCATGMDDQEARRSSPRPPAGQPELHTCEAAQAAEASRLPAAQRLEGQACLLVASLLWGSYAPALR